MCLHAQGGGGQLVYVRENIIYAFFTVCLQLKKVVVVEEEVV